MSKDYLKTYFKLKPIKAAKVSEISEATASSSLQKEERVNFHIGNPVQDKRLTDLYFRLILQYKNELDSEKNDLVEEIKSEFNWGKQSDRIDLLYKTIQASTPYMPRGGFNKFAPNSLILFFHKWLSTDQSEPLNYDLGEKSGKRECIITSGGTIETLRIFLHSLSRYMVELPATILLFNKSIPNYLKDYEELKFENIDGDREALINSLEELCSSEKNKPVFVILGTVPSEQIRRRLRSLSLVSPLFFTEMNDAPNHLSLAREAKMKNRLLRFLTPSIISENLKELSTVFVAGNAEFIKVIETLHFQLKGTPSSTEIEVLNYLTIQSNHVFSKVDQIKSNEVETWEGFELNIAGSQKKFHSINNKLFELGKNILDERERIVGERLSDFQFFSNNIIEKSLSRYNSHILPQDDFSGEGIEEILGDYFKNLDSVEWLTKLSQSFQIAFIKEHPEYKYENCSVISGSSRTALGLLGFYSGIEEVITCDLSWTYEDCFPKVTVVSLTEDLELDIELIKSMVERKILTDPDWRKKGAVVLNNPHNASGKIFSENKIEQLLLWLLEKRIYIIDDLAYQNVLPAESLKGPKTLKQMALELYNKGYLTEDQLTPLITVHSLSKTDCFAGARLAVTEILDNDLLEKFKSRIQYIKPNSFAILIAYLFYRNNSEKLNRFWLLRNKIFADKMEALSNAVIELPEERNRYKIEIREPMGSMYPQMVINDLPDGLSLDWLSSGLATQGIGLVPLSTFARTSKGFELARKTFRLTLGGSDNAKQLLRKTRRVLIDLNRMIAEEESKYNRNTFNIKTRFGKIHPRFMESEIIWSRLSEQIEETVRVKINKSRNSVLKSIAEKNFTQNFISGHLKERLNVFEKLFEDRIKIESNMLFEIESDKAVRLIENLGSEFYKDSISKRKESFRKRLYDRTVHPTQMYALKVDGLFDKAFDQIFFDNYINKYLVNTISQSLLDEYIGSNVAISSIEEADELVIDLKSLTIAEEYYRQNSDEPVIQLLSFWGDWDGSNRPSGQGHRLVAAAVIENVTQLSEILKVINHLNGNSGIDHELLHEVNRLPVINEKFWKLLNEITSLTNYLEKRYKSILPFNIEAGKFRRAAVKLKIAKDPLTTLWQHNDNLEKRMMELRNRRRDKLEYYFALNKKLRKTLHSLLPIIKENYKNEELILRAGSYKDLLKRFVLTPRIHQKLITTRDQFSINTTVHNIVEINEISGKYGNPGMVLGLQVSMSNNPEALISLDRKFNSKREEVLRENKYSILPRVWSIPLFEDTQTVTNIDNYLDKIWDYSKQSRTIDQNSQDRFTEIICEIFVAGSDLSQQVGQTASAELYKESKQRTIKWLAKKGLVEKVRMKLGSGEPMQRQGGYYADFSGKSAFIRSTENMKRFKNHLKESTVKSIEFAVSPLHGLFSGGDLRTLQSNISEKMRHLSVGKRAQMLYHLYNLQKYYQRELERASEPFLETRLQFESRGLKVLERLTIGKDDELFKKFIELSKQNFRDILYGKPEDVVGIHIISYFISRTTPTFRDRPTVRPSRNIGENQGHKILERIAGTIPLSKHGSLLRAIGHNRGQTMILGINQLTSGLFRALNEFSKMEFSQGDGSQLLSDRILPNLHVYEILKSLRLFQDREYKYLDKLLDAYPAGNSAFSLLREDNDSMDLFIPLLQKELLRRHGLNVNEFFEDENFIPDLLPTLRPDLAVLLQPDIFNTNIESIIKLISGDIDADWLNEIERLINIPERVKHWREKIWMLLEKPVKEQVKSFVELAIALNTLSQDIGTPKLSLASSSIKNVKFSTSLSGLLKGRGDDSMRQFLSAAVQYLTRLPEDMVEVPIDIIRALKEVERILKIEKQALDKKEQDLLKFYTLQIARLTGENG